MTKETEIPHVDILMSTFNGSDFLGQQFDSILSQSHRRWRLLVRDDGSQDSTLDLIQSYSSQDSRIVLVDHPSSLDNLGPCRSFARLAEYIDSEVFMFCDQDDVWSSQKVETAACALSQYSGPHAVYTDLKVVGRDLGEISPSFMRFSRFDAVSGVNLRRAIMQNVVVGCTFAGNKELLDASRLKDGTLPLEAMMHDWWLALVAICFGRVTYLETPSILYRQHGKNSLGAKTSGLLNYARLLRRGKPWAHARTYLSRVIAQANAFERYYGDQLDSSQRDVIQRVARIHEATLPRLIGNYINGIRMHALDRNIALWLSHLTGARSSTDGDRRHE